METFNKWDHVHVTAVTQIKCHRIYWARTHASNSSFQKQSLFRIEFRWKIILSSQHSEKPSMAALYSNILIIIITNRSHLHFEENEIRLNAIFDGSSMDSLFLLHCSFSENQLFFSFFRNLITVYS